MKMCDSGSISDLARYGLCRCCLSIGNFKDIVATFRWMDNDEVYTNMIRECFQIELKPFRGLQSTICEMCIVSLRAAYTFRTQVLNAENTLLNKRVKLEYHGSVGSVKKEPPIDNLSGVISGDKKYIVFSDNGFDDEEDFPIKIERKEMKRRNIAIKSAKAKPASNSSKEDYGPRKLLYMKRQKNASDARTLIENSTACPFRWSSTLAYQCFYCRIKFTDTSALRDHTKQHETDKLQSLLSAHLLASLVKVDITDMKCHACSQAIHDLTALRTHLTHVHKKKFYDSQISLIPFKLTNAQLECQFCGKSYTSFMTLNIHLNTHYDNYVCETCGATFMSELRLQTHVKMHDDRTYACKTCKKKYPSQIDLSNHRCKLPPKVRYPRRCHCGETFASFYLRLKHRIEVHDEKYLQQKCEQCDRLFPRSSALYRHMRRVHLNERKHVCDVCNNTFFSKNELSNHKYSHTGEKGFQCSVCDKHYSRKCTLVAHMRIHNNDRRFVCAHCEQAFIQNCSLKAHIAKYHDEQ